MSIRIIWPENKRVSDMQITIWFEDIRALADAA
jgi:hypothetical protein